MSALFGDVNIFFKGQVRHLVTFFDICMLYNKTAMKDVVIDKSKKKETS